MSYFEILKDLFGQRYAEVKQDDDYYYLYKHFRVDTELMVLGVFKNNQLLYTKPPMFNDPYDCYLSIEYDFSKVKKDYVENQLGEKITHKMFKEDKEKYIRRLKKLSHIKNGGDISRNMIFVTCFNNSPLNILMWSHYADNHQGFMIEFKFKKINEKYNNLPQPVYYTNELPVLKVNVNFTTEYYMLNDNAGSELLLKGVLTKASDWQYEREFRLINKENLPLDKDRVLIDFEPEEVASVIFGPKINLDHKNKIKEAVEKFNLKHDSKVKTYQAMLDRKCFRLAVPHHPRLEN